MLNDLIVIDQAFKDPYLLRTFAHDIGYHSKEKNLLPGLKLSNNTLRSDFLDAGWKGYRSDPLNLIDESFYKKIFDELFSNIFDSASNIEYSINSFMHFTCGAMDKIYPHPFRWHTDSVETKSTVDESIHYYKYAGVVYLTPNAPLDGGTSIILSDHNINKVENVFNRAVIYNSNLKHKPNRFFGNTIDDARLTLTFFIIDITLKKR